MAPTKARAVADDSRSEASSTKDRIANLSNGVGSAKMRRGASNLGQSVTAKELAKEKEKEKEKERETPVTVVPSGTTQELNGGGLPGIQWPAMETSTLHAYRHAYRLNTPSAFENDYNQLILSQSGIARHSPTMARRKAQRQQSKEGLANAVRKHFNDTGIVENDAIVEFLYKVKHQDKSFRLRFTPQKSSR